MQAACSPSPAAEATGVMLPMQELQCVT